MIHHIDAAVEDFIREVAGISPHVADVINGAPSAFTDAGLARPMFVFHLWEIAQNKRLNRGDFEDGVVESRPVRRLPTPILSFSYFVTVLAGEPRDEHALLGQVLTAVLANDKLPQAILPAPLREFRIGLDLCEAEDSFPSSLWEPGKNRLGLSLRLSVPAEVGQWSELGAPVESVSLATNFHQPPATPTPQPRSAEGMDPPLRRRRDGSALVMEGRPQAPESP